MTVNPVKIEIVWSGSRKGVNRTSTFTSPKEALKFITFNSPMTVEAIRITGDGVAKFFE